jgi:hypothetical protein
MSKSCLVVLEVVVAKALTPTGVRTLTAGEDRGDTIPLRRTRRHYLDTSNDADADQAGAQ